MIDNQPVVSHDAWIEARKQHLAKEKEFNRLRDELSAQRRELPWERVEKPYSFDGLHGRKTLVDLFAGRSQLVVYHFMLGSDWEAGCKGCSFWADKWHRHPPGASRCHDARHLVGAHGQDQCVQAAHGLDFQMGLFRRLRLQQGLPGDIQPR